MKNNSLRHLFLDELADMYDSENQIVDSLPKLIRLASNADLKEALKNHLRETQDQVRRIERIFEILDLSAFEKRCAAMEGLIEEAEHLTKNKTKSPILDAAIISAAQKVEHYEIASYGTLRSFAKHLDLEDEIVDLIQDSLDEEGAADKKLSKIADGGIFSSGVNRRAVDEELAHGHGHRSRRR